MAALSSISITLDASKALEAAVKRLLKREVLVGIPGESAPRPIVPGQPTPPSNAVIGYVQEFGEPSKNIPARPFLMPGLAKAKPAIIAQLTIAGNATLSGDLAAVDKGLIAVGLVAVPAVKDALLNGTFAPLSDRTIEARARRRLDSGKLSMAASSKNARRFLKLRGEGVPTEALLDAGLAKPLYDTHSLYQSIQSVVQDKGS